MVYVIICFGYFRLYNSNFMILELLLFFIKVIILRIVILIYLKFERFI